jgi:hypothetical protein
LSGAGLLVLALLLVPVSVRANVGPPASGGQVVAEPAGIQDVEITRESLTIDLRPLACNELARVEAVYHLHNRGAEKTLDLLFASGSPGIASFQVSLGDRVLTSRYTMDGVLPASWKAPRQTPGIDGSPLDYLRYRSREVKPVAFTAVVGPGRHTLEVRYAAEAATHLYGHPTVYRQFAYVLAPARSWSGFGGLDVTVHLPPDWRGASAPVLDREGDTLHGSFAEVPADALALTVQAPEGWAYQPLSYGSLGLLGLVLLAGPILCGWAGWRKGRSLALPARDQPTGLARFAWPRALGLAVVWGIAVLGAGLLAVFGPDQVLPAGQESHYGYGQAFALLGVLFLTGLAVPLGFALALVTTVVVRGAAERAREASADPALPGARHEG